MIYASLVPGMPPPKSSDGRTHTLESLINENVDGIITSLPIQDQDKKTVISEIQTYAYLI